MAKGTGRLIKFAKILSANDLGLTGSHQAGITVPKRSPLADLIPVEVHPTENPRLELHPVCSNLSRTVTLTLIYYNNVLRGGTRNEFRLTGISWLRNDLGAQVGDVLEFYLEANELKRVSLAGKQVDMTPIPWTHGWSPKGWK